MPPFKGLEHEEKAAAEPREVAKRALVSKGRRYQGFQRSSGLLRRRPPVL